MLRSILAILLVSKAVLVWSQSSGETKALKELSRQQWEKSRSRYAKMLRKDTLDVEGYYIKSLYFFSPDNPQYNLDTAYESVSKSLYYYESLTLRERERLQKVPLDSALLRNIRKQIDSAAFVRAKDEGSEAAYTYFLEKFPTSVNYGDALHLLHDVAFDTAVEENTYETFDHYLIKYPRSHRATEARENYDRLFFEAKTKDKRLATYRSFLLDNPRSPYVGKVEQKIMEISTASGDPETFRHFIRDFPQSHSAKRASDILYYLVKDEEFTSIPASVWSDSLTNVHQQNRTYLTPFYDSGRFGFMDEQGTDIIPASIAEIDQEYLCGNIVEDVLVIQNKIITRNGAVLFPDDVEEIDDLGYGYLFVVTKKGKNVVLHKSGFEVRSDSPIEDAHLLSGKFISLKCNGRWSLYTLTGKVLIEPEWDEIKVMGSLLALRKNNKWHLLTITNAALIADQYIPDLSQEFDEIKLWADKELIWVRNEDQEGLLNEGLAVKLPLEKRTLRSFHSGMESQGQDSTLLYNNAVEACGSFEEIKTNQYWVSVRQENKWRLYAVSDKSYLSPAFDSIAYKGIFAMGQVKDSVVVYFDAQRVLKFKNVRADFIATRDSSSYLLITNGKLKSLYNAKAEKLFQATYDNIQFADKGTFVVSRSDKKGLVSESGKALLPVVYDAIGDGDGKLIPLLRNTKFGLYNLAEKQEIKPSYDKNVRKYNEALFVVFKDGSYGIIDNKSKPILPIRYEDVRYWNDTSAFVKTNSVWQLYDLKNKKIALDNVKDFKFIAETQNERIAIVRANNNYGVLSTANGVVIPVSFTDIVNVGSEEEPLYLTEKHVEEASIYVVIYYDEQGKLLRRYVYDPDEYEKIYCSNN